MTLKNPMKQHIKVLKASLEIPKNLLFIRKEKSAQNTHAMEEKISTPRFNIVHHIKNILIVVISITILLTILVDFSPFHSIQRYEAQASFLLPLRYSPLPVAKMQGREYPALNNPKYHPETTEVTFALSAPLSHKPRLRIMKQGP